MFRRKQEGAALILLVIVFIMTGAVFIITNFSIDKSRENQHQNTTKALVRAKEALIAFAVTYHDTNTAGGNPRAGFMGVLPCPETAGSVSEGTSIGNCGAQGTNFLGRLPWRTVGVDAIKDSSGACLWYAVSSEYKNSGILDRANLINPAGLSRSEMLNDDSSGMFNLFDRNGNQLRGSTPDNRAVAVIISPGSPLPGQARGLVANTECGGDFLATDFLETFNGVNNAVITAAADTIDSFITSDRTRDNAFNDRIITISQQDIFREIRRRRNFNDLMRNTTQALAQCVAQFGLGNPNTVPGVTHDYRLPWPAAMNLNGADYRDSTAYTEDTASGNHLGRFPVDVFSTDGLTLNPGGQYLLENASCNSVVTDNGNVNLNTIAPTNSIERRIWQNWKDHFFYAVAGDYDASNPNTPAPLAACTNCLTSNAGGSYAAIVLFSAERTGAQARTMPPNDPDTKQLIANYLEGANNDATLDSTGSGDYQTTTINDVAYCINEDMSVIVCP